LLSNEDTKLRRRRRRRRKRGYVNKYLERAAKALVISEPMVAWQNMAEFGRWRALVPLHIYYISRPKN